MKPLSVINDLHLGAIRSGGTTPQTALKLRHYLLMHYENLLQSITTDLLINGDLLDAAVIPMSDLLAAYSSTASWLARGNKLYLSAGNHDLSRNSMTISSFQFLGQLLEAYYPEQVKVINAPTLLEDHNAYVICHLPNQDIFNLALAAVPTCKYLFIHANYDNYFAIQSDSSLNVSREQAESLPVEHIIFGHEHQAKTALAGKVVVVGNQYCSSIADCLGNDQKTMLVITDEGLNFPPTWLAEGSFSRQDWRTLTDTGDFIRVEGSATSEEAGAVVAAISKFRSQSKALVVTNAVSIDGIDAGDINMSLEQIQSFSVLGALLELLTPEEGAVVTNLMQAHSVQ